MQEITPFLWFDNQAEEAAKFYTSILKNSKVGKITRYGKEGHETHQRPAGSAEFEIEGQQFYRVKRRPAFQI